MGTPVEDIRLIETGDPSKKKSYTNKKIKIDTIQNKYFIGN